MSKRFLPKLESPAGESISGETLCRARDAEPPLRDDLTIYRARDNQAGTGTSLARTLTGRIRCWESGLLQGPSRP